MKIKQKVWVLGRGDILVCDFNSIKEMENTTFISYLGDKYKVKGLEYTTKSGNLDLNNVGVLVKKDNE